MLELKNISKSFQNIPVIDNISLSINRGETISILGPSGSGKTTLLNLILGITEVDNGQIFLGGKDITNLSMKKRGFNIVFQDYALFPNLSVEKNIRYGLKNKKEISSEEEVQSLIELLDIGKHLNKPVNQLSGGQRQRVALARTLVMKPKILLLDEPLSALDGAIKENIKSRIQEIVTQFQLTTIIVTHDPEEALTMSDRVLILDQGAISQYDNPQKIVHEPANIFVREFILRQLEIKKENIYQLFGEKYVKE